MPKIASVTAHLKAVLLASSLAFARGDMLPVVVISALFNLAQLNPKSISHKVAVDQITSSPDHELVGPRVGRIANKRYCTSDAAQHPRG
jgi:hypothetical protein